MQQTTGTVTARRAGWRASLGAGEGVERRVALALAALALVNVGVRLTGDPIGARLTVLGWLCNATFLLAALACGARARTAPARTPWLLTGVALALYLVADVVSRAAGPDLPYPSVADGLWLGFYVLVAGAIVMDARDRGRVRLPTAWADAVVAALAVGAAAAAWALGPLLGVGTGSRAAVLTSLAYPVADLVLLMLVVATLHVAPPRSPATLLYAGGLVLFLAADVVFLVAQAEGSWSRGAPSELLWILGATGIGASALWGAPPGPARPSPPTLVVSLLSAVLVTGVLVGGQLTAPLPRPAVGLAAAAALAIVGRVALGVRELRAAAQLEASGRVDPLTRLPSRCALVEGLASDLASGGRTAVLAISVDGFGDVTGSLGWNSADRVISVLAARLDSALAPSWSSARVGEDEFALVIPLSADLDLVAVAHEVRRRLAEPIDVAGVPLSVGTTVGIACAPDDARSGEELLGAADHAVRQARRHRGHVARYRPGEAHPGPRRLLLRSELHHALSHGQVIAHFQPQVDLTGGGLVGVEALARWVHPTRGVVPPGAFLPLVGECDLLAELTHVMVREVGPALGASDRRGLGLSVSLNVSAVDLADDEVVDRIERALVGIRGADATLTLEITEDAVLVDVDRAAAVLARLRDLGARVSVDDYGTGQASLSYLRDLPLDELKLDRTFVQGAASDPRAAAMARSTLELARELGLLTVGEGIEDEPTARWLAARGCDVGQGYLYARPMPLGELLPWIEGWAGAADGPASGGRGLIVT